LTQLLTIVPIAQRSLTQSIDLEQLALTGVNNIIIYDDFGVWALG
jgi:hypothetical protein